MEETNGTEKPTNAKNAGKIVKIILKVTLWAAGIWAAILVILQIVLSSPLLTNLVEKYSKEYIDGDISFGKVSVSMFRQFPNVALTLEDFSITYPSERYESSAKTGAQGYLIKAGCGTESDTLARFKRFTVGLDIPALLTGRISIPQLSLIQPGIFIHNYADGRSNLETLIIDDSVQEEDSSSNGIPDMKIGKVTLDCHPHVVFTDSKDSIFTVIDFKKLDFDGKIDTRNISRTKLAFSLDSMFIAGRVATDTVALGMDRVYIHEHDKHIDLSAQAKTFVGTRALGRITIPIALNAGITFPEDTIPAVSVEHFNLSVASLPIKGNAHLRFNNGSTYISSSVNITDCHLDDMLKDLVSYFAPEADKISTDAVLSMTGKCEGEYIHSTGKFPPFEFNIKVPEAEISHSDFKKTLKFEIDAGAVLDKKGRINAKVRKAGAATSGLSLTADGKIYDILSSDPTLRINANMTAVLDSIAAAFIPDSLGTTATGTLEAGINGSAKLSQLDIYNFGKAELTGQLKCRKFKFDSPSDSINLFVDKMNLKLGPETIKSDKGKLKLLSLSGDIDSLYASYKKGFEVSGKNLSLTAKNSVSPKNTVSSQKDTSEVKPLGFRIKAGLLTIKDAESAAITLDKTENGFLIYPDKNHKEIPIMTLKSSNKRIFLRNATNRIILTDASFSTKAAMNTVARREKIRKFTDSLALAYPDIPKDSLFRHLSALRNAEPLPEWLKEEDFKKHDPDLRLEKSLAKYFREWDLNGNLKVRTGILMTPYFPLRNILRGLDISFTNNKVTIDTISVISGESRLAANGSLTGIRSALLGGRRPLKLTLDITSKKMNTNELLKAYSAGSRFKPEESENLENASDKKFLQMVTDKEETLQDSTSLIVIPSNIIANITFNAGDITYSNLAIKSLTSNITMKERCVQITDTKAVSNAGNISFDGFYSTRSKRDIKAGFNFNFSDITAEKVVSLMPVVDTIMPMLKSFNGMLDCELAATAVLDTNMNIVMPSINGVLRIGGKNLTIKNNDMFRSIARKLKFNDSETGFIDNMTVEGVIKDNVLEVFPFVLKMDRYTLAMSGIQNLDMSFRYHVSIVKSPIIFRLGIDLYGNDFDNLKFRIGKPKYKNTNIPVFSSVINDTKINLLKSIKGIFEKGVEAAVNENEQQKAIEQLKKDIGYINAAEQQIVPLSVEEQLKLEGKDVDMVESNSASGSGIAVRKDDKKQ